MVYITIPADNNFLKILKANSTNRVGFGKSIWNVDGQNLRLGVILKKNSTFVTHESLDIAAFPIEFFSYDRAEDGSEKLRYTSKAAITTSIILKRSEIKVGTETFFVGFPFSIGTNQGYNLAGSFSSKVANPLIRLGSVAWISNDSPEFLLDAFSYGGNSGSPVFTKSTLFKDNYLIGMTIGHLGDSLIDQNGNKLIDGNFGLARCIWIDEILKVYEKAILLE